MNIARYGTGKFRAIGSLSESAIVDFYGTGDLQPEKRLMLAVLQGAVECFQDYAEDDRLFKETEEWIFEDDHEWPFSFINICQAVDLNPKYLRKGLLHWRQRAVLQAHTSWRETLLNKHSRKRCALSLRDEKATARRVQRTNTKAAKFSARVPSKTWRQPFRSSPERFLPR
jgi:hypothetical protein